MSEGKQHYNYERIVKLWELAKGELPRPAYHDECLWRDASWSNRQAAFLDLLDAHGNWFDANLPISNLGMNKSHLFVVAYSQSYFESTQHPSTRPLFDLPFPREMLADIMAGQFLLRTTLDVDIARDLLE